MVVAAQMVVRAVPLVAPWTLVVARAAQAPHPSMAVAVLMVVLMVVLMAAPALQQKRPRPPSMAAMVQMVVPQEQQVFVAEPERAALVPHPSKATVV